jgi:hypothetical protein
MSSARPCSTISPRGRGHGSRRASLRSLRRGADHGGRQRRKQHRRRFPAPTARSIRLPLTPGRAHPFGRHGALPTGIAHGDGQPHPGRVRRSRCAGDARSRSGRAAAREIWSQVAWFTPNETEAAFYLGNAMRPEAAANELAGARPAKAWCSSAAAKEPTLPSPVAKRSGCEPFRVRPWTPWARATASTAPLPWRCLKAATHGRRRDLLRRRRPFLSPADGAQASMPSRAEVDDFLLIPDSI